MPINTHRVILENANDGGPKKLLLDALIESGRLPPDLPHLRLVRADRARFGGLEDQWRMQTEAFGEHFEDFAAPFIDHAREIANGRVNTPAYGIYLLEGGEGYEALAHLNAARLPGTVGRTLRLLWVLLAPKYDYQDTTPETLSHISTAFIWEPLRLASEPNNPLGAEHVKIHLNNLTDRSFFVGIASALQGASGLRDVAVRGNWLHLSRA